MKVDKSTANKIVRIILDIMLLPLVFVERKTSRSMIGLIPLTADAEDICPFYAVFGIKTCKINKQA